MRACAPSWRRGWAGAAPNLWGVSGTLRIALAQTNCVVGDIAGNEEKIRRFMGEARDRDAQLVLFPELAVTGYPPEDLLLKEHFLADARAAVQRLAAEAEGIVAVVGFPERTQDVFNAAALLAYLSGIVTLHPGDLVFTGTPPGVGFARKPPVFLKAGDVVEVEIQKLGVLRNPVVQG